MSGGSTDELVLKNETGVVGLGMIPSKASCIYLLFTRISLMNKTLNSLKPTYNFELHLYHEVRKSIDLFHCINSGLCYDSLIVRLIVSSPKYQIYIMKTFEECYSFGKMSKRILQTDDVLVKWKHTKATSLCSINIFAYFIRLVRRMLSCFTLKDIVNGTRLCSNNILACLIHLVRRMLSCLTLKYIGKGFVFESRVGQFCFSAVEHIISRSCLATNILELSSYVKNNLITQLCTTGQQNDRDEDTAAIDVCHTADISGATEHEGRLDKSDENTCTNNSFVVVASIENISRFDADENDQLEIVSGGTVTELIKDEAISDTSNICQEEQYFSLSKLTPTETWKLKAFISRFHENFSVYFALPRIYHRNTVTSTSGSICSFGDCSPSNSSSFKTYSLKEPRGTAVAVDHTCGYNGLEKAVLSKDPNIISLAAGKHCADYQPIDINTTAAVSINERACAQEEILEKLHDYTLFSLSEAEMRDVQKSIEFIVHRLLYKVGEEDSRFYVREVVPNGSFYDGTKICRPDEFDYLAVIEKLSNPGVNVSRHNNHNEGFAHVQLDGNLSLDWDDICTNGALCCVKQQGLASFRDQFRILFNDTLRNETADKMKVKIHKLSGVLLISGLNVSIHGPECIVTARWYSKTIMKSFPITVDICPAIQADCVSSIITEKEALFQSAYLSMLKNERYFLIPSDSRSCTFCFKLAFPDSDRSLVTELNEAHRKCFRILKLLFREATYADYNMHSILNSFGLKMAILRHADSCVNSTMRSCIIEVLTYLRQTISLEVPYLPNVHVRTRNIWRTLDVTENKDRKTVTAVVKQLDKLIDIITDTTLADEFHTDRFLKYVHSFGLPC